MLIRMFTVIVVDERTADRILPKKMSDIIDYMFKIIFFPKSFSQWK